jgi:circadian clock protein KaiB
MGGGVMLRSTNNLEQFERARSKQSRQGYVLTLYVSGATQRSLEAVERVKKICDAVLAGRYRLSVVDIFQQPSRAVRDQVIAVPMLVKERPLPIRKLIGTLSNPGQILQAFGVPAPVSTPVAVQNDAHGRRA